MSSSAKPTSDPFFPSIRDAAEQTDKLENPDSVNDDAGNDGGDEDRPLQEVESLCMSCGEQGITRMLLTSIPYFKEVIVMSFRCEHCGTSNNEIQSAGAYREHGTIYTVKVLSRDDLDRQLVKSSTCTVTIPEYALTIPSGRGQLTTIEGILRDTVRDLAADQPLRRIQDEATYEKIQSLLDNLNNIIADSDAEDDDDDVEDSEERKAQKEEERKKAREDRLARPIPIFTLMLDDPTGNSFAEFKDSMADPQWTMRTYNRTREQNATLGLAVATNENGEPVESTPEAAKNLGRVGKSLEQAADEAVANGANEEIFIFPGSCGSCGADLDTMMKKVVIPYFKDIIIMSTNCTNCGYRDNEVKSGGEVSEKGKKISLKVEDAEDLSRDVLKSETCGLEIPEIDLVLQPGTLGGRFTTLEGILSQVYDELSEKVFSTDLGDSSADRSKIGDENVVSGSNAGQSEGRERNKFATFLGNLKSVIAAERPFTLILDDPLANSYLQNIYAPDDDPNMEITLYERTFDQNDDLGLNDMKLEGYEEEHERETAEKAEKEGVEAADRTVV